MCQWPVAITLCQPTITSVVITGDALSIFFSADLFYLYLNCSKWSIYLCQLVQNSPLGWTTGPSTCYSDAVLWMEANVSSHWKRTTIHRGVQYYCLITTVILIHNTHYFCYNVIVSQASGKGSFWNRYHDRQINPIYCRQYLRDSRCCVCMLILLESTIVIIILCYSYRTANHAFFFLIQTQGLQFSTCVGWDIIILDYIIQ